MVEKKVSCQPAAPIVYPKHLVYVLIIQIYLGEVKKGAGQYLYVWGPLGKEI